MSLHGCIHGVFAKYLPKVVIALEAPSPLAPLPQAGEGNQIALTSTPQADKKVTKRYPKDSTLALSRIGQMQFNKKKPV